MPEEKFQQYFSYKDITETILQKQYPVGDGETPTGFVKNELASDPSQLKNFRPV